MRTRGRRFFSLVFLGLCSSANASETTVNGFVDGQYINQKLLTRNRSFLVFDGAVYVKKEMEKAHVYLDIPVSVSGANSNTLAIATTQAQAYFGYKYENGFSWRLGQFDFLYGFVKKDSADRFWATNVVSGSGFWKTSLGLDLMYHCDITGLDFHAYVAQPKNAGVKTADENYDHGITIARPGDLSFSVGARQWKPKATLHFDRTYQAIVGYKMDKLALTLGFAFRNNQSTKAVGNAVYFSTTYGFDDKWAAGLRYENTRKFTEIASGTVVGAQAVTRASTHDKLWQVTVGPKYTVTKSLVTRADFTYAVAEFGKDTTRPMSYALSAVYSF
jgi:hypothetical protein